MVGNHNSGRTPKPLELAILDGGASHVARNAGPKPDEDVGECPPDEIEEVRDHWNKCREEWALLLSSQDAQQLLEYCRKWVEWDGCYQRILRDGAYTRTGAGAWKVAPWAVRELALGRELSRYRASFGATPVDRNRIPGKYLPATVRKKMSAQDLLT